MQNSEFQLKNLIGSFLIFHHLFHSCLRWYVFVPFLHLIDTTMHGCLLRYQNFTSCEQSAANLKVYYATCFTLIAGIMVFGGFLAPIVSYNSQFCNYRCCHYWLYCRTKCIGS